VAIVAAIGPLRLTLARLQRIVEVCETPGGAVPCLLCGVKTGRGTRLGHADDCAIADIKAMLWLDDYSESEPDATETSVREESLAALLRALSAQPPSLSDFAAEFLSKVDEINANLDWIGRNTSNLDEDGRPK
jgi:hypothetical protein